MMSKKRKLSLRLKIPTVSPLKLQSGEPRSAPPGLHRGSVFSDHSQAAHRPEVTTRAAPEGGEPMDTAVTVAVKNVDQVFSQFMIEHKCYDIIPTSAKLVIFDTQLNVKKAFFALIYNDVRAAPLWDSVSQDYVGMLTITDFISILRRLYRSPNARMDELEDHTILNWRVMERERQRPFIRIPPNATLYDAVKSLTENHVHRLPVVDDATGNALFIVTHKRILRFLSTHYLKKENRLPTFMSSSIRDLGIGTYTNVITATLDTTVITALNLFMDNRISALPVVNSSEEVVSIYSRFDVITLAADKSYNNLDITIGDALKSRSTKVVDTCIPSDTLGSVIDKLAIAGVHRLVIVDENNHVEGILSLSDILKFIILKPMEVAPANAAEQAPQDQPPLAEDSTIIEESPFLESDIMGAESSQASS